MVVVHRKGRTRNHNSAIPAFGNCYRDQCQRRNRFLGGITGIDLLKKVPGPVNIIVNELINRLRKEDRMNLDYKEKNGKHFANFIYDKIFSP